MKLLILAPNWLGDLVMALPAIADVRRHHRDATITVAARRPLAPLAAMIPGVADSISLDGRGGVRMVTTLRGDIDRLRTGRFDAALLLPNSFHAALLVRQARVPERWGFGADLRNPLLTRAVPKPRVPRLHQAEYYQHLTRALGIPPGALVADICLADRHRTAADELLRAHGWDGRPLVGVAPGAAYGWAKRWPPERMGALAAALARDAGAAVVLVGAAADRDTVAIVTRTAAEAGAGPADVIDLAGKTDLPAFAGVLARCGAFVSNDSGAMHLAAAVDVPVIGIFGPTREWATSPLPGPRGTEPAIVRTDAWCRPCMLRTCPLDHRCMTGISVDDVLTPALAAVRQIPVSRGAR